MLDENKIKILLEDIKSVYLVGYFKDDLTTEAEKWGQIQILEYILSQTETRQLKKTKHPISISNRLELIPFNSPKVPTHSSSFTHNADDEHLGSAYN